MKLFKLAAATILALGLGAGAAFAADPIIDPPVLVSPGFDWTGFYAGIKAGAGVVNYTGTVGPNTATWSAPGFAIGGLIGAQKQIGKWVLGVEGDVSWVGANGTVPPVLAVGTSSTQWLASFRGKLGIAVNRWMLYGTAGVAVLNNNITVNGGIQPTNNTHLGAVVGVGFDYALRNRWVLTGGANYYAFSPQLYNPDVGAHFADVFVGFYRYLGGSVSPGELSGTLTGEDLAELQRGGADYIRPY